MKIRPFREFGGIFSVPGDKSITHRAVMLSAAAEGNSVIENALLGGDCLSTISCMRELGAKIEIDGGTVTVKGREDFLSGKTLNAGNSGTTMRLLTGLLAGKGIDAVVFGDESLSKRPMGRVIQPLTAMGSSIESGGGFAPLKVAPAELKGIDYTLPVASAQVKSAVLLAGLNAEGRTTVRESVKSRDHTELMLRAMGADIEIGFNSVSVNRSKLKSVDVYVPGDISAAAYLFAAGLLLGGAKVKGLGLNETRSGILKAIELLGGKYSIDNPRIQSGEETGDVTVLKSPLKGACIGGELIPKLIDEIPVIAVLAAFAEGRTVIKDAKELRVKESDRIKTVKEMICAIGGCAFETDDGLIIEGRESLKGGVIRSYGDHRIAMSGTVALMASKEGGFIDGADCADISFPGFYSKMEAGDA